MFVRSITDIRFRFQICVLIQGQENDYLNAVVGNLENNSLYIKTIHRILQKNLILSPISGFS